MVIIILDDCDIDDADNDDADNDVENVENSITLLLLLFSKNMDTFFSVYVYVFEYDVKQKNYYYYVHLINFFIIFLFFL